MNTNIYLFLNLIELSGTRCPIFNTSDIASLFDGKI